MKKIFAIIFTLLLIFIAGGCNSANKPDISGNGSGISAAKTQLAEITPAAGEAAQAAFTSENITVGAGTGYPLDGILTMPDGASAGNKCPAAVLVQGSGPSDMDETINSDKPFKDIAEYLSSNGIAVIRYNKRTYTYGAKMVQELGADLTVEQETIQDALLATQIVKSDPRIDADKVFLLGHSLGGMLAPRIDAEGGDYAGLIIMAGSLRSLEDITYDQLMARVQLQYKGTDNYDLAMSQMADIKLFLDSIKSMTDDEAKNTQMNDHLGAALGGGVSAYYYKDMDDHPAAAYIADMTKPMLIMQGLSDIQIYPDVDFKGYQDLLSARDNVAFKTYDGLTHLFMQATENDTVGNQNAYTTPEHVDAQVLQDIADWVNAN